MTIQHVTVAPIHIGFPFEFSISFKQPDGTALPGFDLTAATRVMGQARVNREDKNTPIATFDTSDNTLTVVDADTLTFTISADRTSRIKSSRPVWIDFAQLVSGAWEPIPVQIEWPVVDSVTIPPTV